MEQPASVQDITISANYEPAEKARYMQSYLLRHVVPSDVVMNNTPFVKQLAVGHEILRVKERDIVMMSRAWEQHLRDRDWGTFRFHDNHDHEHSWMVDSRGCGADGKLLILPAVRLHTLLDAMQHESTAMARRDYAEKQQQMTTLRELLEAGNTTTVLDRLYPRADMEEARQAGIGPTIGHVGGLARADFE